MSETRQRYHPLLPTVDAVQKNLAERKAGEGKSDAPAFSSDHLPNMAVIPLREVKGIPAEGKRSGSEAAEELKIITWNVQAPSARASGFSAEESDEHVESRGLAAIETLIRFIDQHQPDAILLQETYFHDPVLEINRGTKVRQKLDTELKVREWTFKSNDQNIFTLYNTRTLQEAKKEKKEPARTSGTRDEYTTKTLTLNFHTVKFNTPVTINNVHWPHNEAPDEAEQKISDLIQQDKGVVVIAGDFNNRLIAPGKSYLVNNAVPPLFRLELFNEPMQGADWTDGCFYSDMQGKCHQSSIIVLDPSTGHPEDDMPIESSRFFIQQEQELRRQRLFVCVAEEHALTKDFNQSMLDTLKQKGIIIKRSANAFNEQMIVIQCPLIPQEEKHPLVQHLTAHTTCPFTTDPVRGIGGIKVGTQTFIPVSRIVEVIQIIDGFLAPPKPSNFKWFVGGAGIGGAAGAGVGFGIFFSLGGWAIAGIMMGAALVLGGLTYGGKRIYDSCCSPEARKKTQTLSSVPSLGSGSVQKTMGKSTVARQNGLELNENAPLLGHPSSAPAAAGSGTATNANAASLSSNPTPSRSDNAPEKNSIKYSSRS
jgi:hypothetical protein